MSPAKTPPPAAYQVVHEPVDTEEIYVSELACDLQRIGYDHAGFVRFRVGSATAEFPVQFTPDKLSFAFARDLFNRPHVALRTLAENGSVIETRTRPETRQEHVWLLRPWQHHPRAGYHLESHAPGTAIDVLQRRHRERVEAVCAQERTRVRPHTELDIALAILNRAWRLRTARTRLGVGIGICVGLSLLAAGLTAYPLLLTINLVALPLSIGYLGPGLARLSPLPRRVPADDLVGPDLAGHRLH
ncbi:MAG: hypothetical protein R3B13_40690 [Polyangiaceae bacterium]